MNLQSLRYAIEVEHARSITQAAQRLFMSQPNLSKAIRELEEELGITIFRRTSRGVVPTRQGEEFLNYARTIVSQVDELESLYRDKQPDLFHLSISVPRATYFSAAFAEYYRSLDLSGRVEIHFKETDAATAIQDVAAKASDFAVIRYEAIYESYFLSLLTDRSLRHELLHEFEYQLMMSASHPLSGQAAIPYHQLSGYTEVVHGGRQAPALSFAHIRHGAELEHPPRRIYVYDRGSQLDFLRGIPGTYMWVSPVPEQTLKQYGLVTRPCSTPQNKVRDVLVFQKKHLFRDPEKELINRLKAQISALSR